MKMIISTFAFLKIVISTLSLMAFPAFGFYVLYGLRDVLSGVVYSKYGKAIHCHDEPFSFWMTIGLRGVIGLLIIAIVILVLYLYYRVPKPQDTDSNS